MNTRAYYNDTSKAAVAVMRELISDGVIAPGDVDDRSIEEVQPDDLAGYTQVHFFAGGGLWSVAARLAGWPDARPLWTGSCPCQPFSGAGQGRGIDDPRHLWPHFLRLIRGARTAGFGPPVIVGEQVSKKAGYGWLDGVRADLAAEGYACRARDIPALAVDAPHERNRLFWLAVDDAKRHGQREQGYQVRAGRNAVAFADGELADRNAAWGLQPKGHIPFERGWAGNGDDGGVGNRPGFGCKEAVGEPRDDQAPIGVRTASRAERPHGRNGSFWSNAEWIVCHDGKARRTKPGLPLLVDGFPGRVDLWSLAGNAISPVLAAEVIGAFLDAEKGG